MVVFQHQLQSQSQPQLQQSTSGPNSQTKKTPLMPLSSSSTSSVSSAWFFPVQSSPSSDMWEIPHCTSSTSTASSTYTTTLSMSSSSWLSPTPSFSSTQSTPTTTTSTASRMATMEDRHDHYYYNHDQHDHNEGGYGLSSFTGLSDPSSLQLFSTDTNPTNTSINYRFPTMEDQGIIASRDDRETISGHRTDVNDERDGVDDDGVFVEENDDGHYHYDENNSENGDDRGLRRDASPLSISPQPTRVVLADATNTVRRTAITAQSRSNNTNGVPRRNSIGIRNINRSTTVVRRSQFY